MDAKIKAKYLFEKYLVLAADESVELRHRTSRESCRFFIKEILKEFNIENNRQQINEKIDFWQNVFNEVESEYNESLKQTSCRNSSQLNKYKNKLWKDLENDTERAEFIECGRSWETGVIAKAIENDVYNAFHSLSIESNLNKDQLKSTMLKVKIKPERENFKQPIKGTEESACYDCYCAHLEEMEDGLVICYLGFSQEIPKGWKAIIDPRSSIRNTGWVMANSRGTVDSDYRGELQASFRPLLMKFMDEYEVNDFRESHSIVKPNFPYKVGDRVCQISWERVNEVEFEITDTLSESNREGGHGSTGLK